MKVILLCAGYATRLYPLTENQPKPLLPLADRPILEYILDRLKPVEGIEEVIAVTNNKFSTHFEKWAKNLSYPWPVTSVNDQTTTNDDRLGAIGDLHYVLSQRNIGAEDILVIAGDNLFDFDLEVFMRFSKKKRPCGVIAAYDVKDKVLAKQYGLLQLNGEGRVTEFLEKPENPPTTLASCGLYWLPRETRVLLDRYISEGHNADQPGHYMRWLAETQGLYGVALDGQWYDIGDLKSYQSADALFRKSLQN